MPPLKLTGEIVRRAAAEDLLDELAHALMSAGQAAVEQRGVFHLALSGGSTPEPLYVLLVSDPRFRGIPWQQTHVWLVDERCVPEDDEKSNYRMIRETVLDHVPMRERQKHPMPVLAADAAGQYEADLRQWVSDGQLDFVLLGMGDDAHTASLFPHSPALAERERWVAVNAGPRVTPPDRLTLTYPLLNQARALALLVLGERKAPTLRTLSEGLRAGAIDAEKYPVVGVRPTAGRLTWYLDAPAAGITL